MNLHTLDNPVYNALNEMHQDFAISIDSLKAYQPEILPFGGFKDLIADENTLSELSKLTSNFMIIGNLEPKIPAHLEIKSLITCYQMMNETLIEENYTDEIVFLNENYQSELYEIITTFYSGFFRKKTAVLGNYYGVFRDQKLVAVTGERFNTNNFTEVSAVVTNTDYTGLGLAKQLVTFVNNRIIKNGKTPFLHVDVKNTGAIKLYEKLGFKVRTEIKVWVIGNKNL